MVTPPPRPDTRIEPPHAGRPGRRAGTALLCLAATCVLLGSRPATAARVVVYGVQRGPGPPGKGSPNKRIARRVRSRMEQVVRHGVRGHQFASERLTNGRGRLRTTLQAALKTRLGRDGADVGIGAMLGRRGRSLHLVAITRDGEVLFSDQAFRAPRQRFLELDATLDAS